MSKEAITASRRHCILVALSIATGYTAAIRSLRESLSEIGQLASLDLLRTDSAWLIEQGLVLSPNTDVLQLTERGRDVVLGYSHTPGVKRPEPGEVDSLTDALNSTGAALGAAGWPRIGS